MSKPTILTIKDGNRVNIAKVIDHDSHKRCKGKHEAHIEKFDHQFSVDKISAFTKDKSSLNQFLIDEFYTI